MAPIPYLSWQVQRMLTDPRTALLTRVVILVALLAMPAVARAYAFEQFVTWSRNTVVAPLVFVAIAVSICLALVRPQLAAAAVWVTIIGLFLMYVLSSGQTITSKLQQTQGD